MKQCIRLAFSLLALLSSCEKEEAVKSTEKPPYGGVLAEDSLSKYDTLTLTNTTWVIYKWSSGLQTTDRSDTIYFSTQFTYSYNQLFQTYSMYASGSQYSLKLNGTPLGDISGLVPRNFIFYGELTSTLFKDVSIGNNGQTYKIWVKKID